MQGTCMIYEAGQRVETFDKFNLKSLVSDLFSNLKLVPHTDFRRYALLFERNKN